MRNSRLLLMVAGGIVLAGLVGGAAAEGRRSAPPPPRREIYVPFDDLSVLLAQHADRVLLSREEYEALRRAAEVTPAVPVPRAVVVAAAEYAAVIEQERAVLTGQLSLDVLAPGLHAVDLDLSDVGLRRATLDGAGAAIGRAADGRLQLFVSGVGRHELTLEMVTAVQTAAALQSLTFSGPWAAAVRLNLSVPGDVQLRGGAPVIERRYDEAGQVTRFELLPHAGPIHLVLTLNNRLLQTQRVVLARGVLVDEVTAAYERLHATFSMAVLHRAVDHFRFELPAGFEVTDVHSPLLSRWAVEDGGEAPVLDVQLREATTEAVLITLSALRAPVALEAWGLPRLRPLDVVGETIVAGVLLEDHLKLNKLDAERLIPIDAGVLTKALPPSVFEVEPGAPLLRPVAAFYAPVVTGEMRLRAEFEQVQPRVVAVTNLLLTVADEGATLHGGFALQPEVDPLDAIRIGVPAGWHLVSVVDDSGCELPFVADREDAGADGAAIAHVRLNRAIAPGTVGNLRINATSVPDGWLDDWTTHQVAFPAVAVLDVAEDTGVLAVQPGLDLTALPETLTALTPLDQQDAARHGLPVLSAAQGVLAYRYDGPGYAAVIRVERQAPRLTARSYSFFRVEPSLLSVHYELVYEVQEARVRRLSFRLPATTPADLSLRALGDAAVKEYESAVVGEERVWTAELERRTSGTVRLAVDLEQQLADSDAFELDLPVIRAQGVTYQAGFVATQSGPELNVQMVSPLRRVDVGELAGAEYQPRSATMGGLSAYGFVGEAPAATVSVARPVAHALPAAVIEQMGLDTTVSAEGLCQTAALLRVRARTAYVEVVLPPNSTLWAAELDDQPAKPQQEGQHLLLSLHGEEARAVRAVRLVYETPIAAVGGWGEIAVLAPKLLLPGAGVKGQAVEVPVADARWDVRVPTGYRVMRNSGTLSTSEIGQPTLAAWSAAQRLYALCGGVHLFYGGLMPSLSRAREISKPAMRRLREMEAGGGRGDQASNYGEVYADYDSDGAVDELSEPEATAEKEPQPQRGLRRAPAAPPALSAPPVPPMEQVRKSKDVGRFGSWLLEGVRSLRIEMQTTDAAITFRSLGQAPELRLTLADWRRVEALSWSIAAAAGLVGLCLTTRTRRARVLYVLGLALAATLVPLVTNRPEWAHVTNLAFYVACLLVPYYVLAAIVRWCGQRMPWRARAVAPAAAVLLMVLAAGRDAVADEPRVVDASGRTIVIELPEPSEPVVVPADAIIVPYELGRDPTGIGPVPADRVLVPRKEFEALWLRAHPDVAAAELPVAYALSGATYAARLERGEYLEVQGRMAVRVYASGGVDVPLRLAGGVLARAELDGEPARLGLIQAAAARDADSAVMSLRVGEPGTHELVLTVRLPVERRGGWHVVRGTLPAAAATALDLLAPEAGTEIRLANVADRRQYETEQDGATIATTLGRDGGLDLQWRPVVRTGEIDASLTVASQAVLDVREDGLRLAWVLGLDFGRREHASVTAVVPAGYLVQRVSGTNVRGWSVRTREDAGEAAAQEVEITLLKAAQGTEEIVLVLQRAMAIGAEKLDAYPMPVVAVSGAALHNGRFVLRRSPRLDLRVQPGPGVVREDVPADVDRLAAQFRDEDVSPLGIQAYQAYRFTATPFRMELTATAEARPPDAELQTLVRIGERTRNLETRVLLRGSERPVYEVRVAMPLDLHVEYVSAPGAFEWAVDEAGEVPVLVVRLATGQRGEFAVVVRGQLGAEEAVQRVPLPVLEVLGCAGQRGTIIVQVDPAFDVKASELRRCRQGSLVQAIHWVADDQRSLARLALEYLEPPYSGVLELTQRVPQVTCSTIVNVRVTDATIEETILLEFDIVRAGIREIAFELPEWMREARISVPLLRTKDVRPTKDEAGAPLKVTLTLQEEVMGHLRVLVENDRLLTPEVHWAPIPRVVTGQTERCSVALESAGRDEVVVSQLQALEPLTHQQREWRTLAELLGGEMAQAYAATGPAPALGFAIKERKAVETAGARIGLARTVLVADAQGAYRASQRYRVDNTSESYLEVELPAGAALWSAVVAGQPVKPAAVPGAAQGRVRIPLVQTAEGELDFEVVLNYGGEIALPGPLDTVAFPFLRTVNVSVELSQVWLYLPEEYNWFRFDGTAGRVEDEGDLAAGYVHYQTQVATRLTQAMQHGSAFTQARAASSFKGLQAEQQELAGVVERYGYNESLERELNSNTAIVGQAVEWAAKVEERSAGELAATDNRGKLNGLYDAQRTTRARNLVQDLGGNFLPGQVVPADETAAGLSFNQQWLEANGLRDEDAMRGGAQGKRIQSVDDKATQAAGPISQQAAPQVWDQAELGVQYGRVARRRGGSQKSVDAARYQQRLEELNAGGQYGIQADDTSSVIAFGGLSAEDVEAVISELEGSSQAMGLASLSVEFPQRGRLYMFATPRGAVAITARAIAEPTLAATKQVGVAAAVVLVGVVLWWLARRREAAGQFHQTWPTVLVVLGAACVVTGVLPLAGLAAIIYGLVLRARRGLAAASAR